MQKRWKAFPFLITTLKTIFKPNDSNKIHQFFARIPYNSISGKVVGYKVEIPIPDPWMLKEEEVLANESCQGI